MTFSSPPTVPTPWLFSYGHQLTFPKRGLRASISRLYFSCSPSDITGSVIAIIINAVECQTGRSFTDFAENVSEKGYELRPSLTDFDTTSAVIFIIVAICIVAAVTHTFPDKVQWMLFTNSRVAVDDPFMIETSTRTSVPTFKTITTDNGSFSTVTSAKPKGMTIGSLTGKTDYCEETEALICNINAFGHRTAPTVRGQVARLVRSTPASLRTITWVEV